MSMSHIILNNWEKMKKQVKQKGRKGGRKELGYANLT